MKARPDPEATMSLDDFLLIRDFVHEKSGIYFAENKMYLVKNRLQRRMAELDISSFGDYFYRIKYDNTSGEFNRLMSLLTTNETSFFRNEPQLLSFAEEILPKIIAAKEKANEPRTLRVWSAGCATGEEPYTLAMILLERFGDRTDWHLEVVANDISKAVLHSARIGEYSEAALRTVKPELREKYFTLVDNVYRINARVKSLVRFSHINLNDRRQTSLMRNIDVIFCRNVMIYFSEDVKRHLVRGFYDALRPGGYLYIGHAETLHSISKAFKLVYFKNALVYFKEGLGSLAGNLSAKPKDDAVSERMYGSDSAARAIEMLNQIKDMELNR